MRALHHPANESRSLPYKNNRSLSGSFRSLMDPTELAGYPASEYAIEAAARHGNDIRFHRSRQLSEEVVKDADLILTMERNHTNIIKQNWSDINCVYELKNFSHEKLENESAVTIMDPIGMSFDVYLNVFHEIKKAASPPLFGFCCFPGNNGFN